MSFKDCLELEDRVRKVPWPFLVADRSWECESQPRSIVAAPTGAASWTLAFDVTHEASSHVLPLKPDGLEVLESRAEAKRREIASCLAISAYYRQPLISVYEMTIQDTAGLLVANRAEATLSSRRDVEATNAFIVHSHTLKIATAATRIIPRDAH